mmetsp:Transcript_16718/g.21234  ORF Transcript_16718/g.21234 Transcript_16718/m.21234 type:complete len:465 (-) Transcript_16718:153-1547(-)
MLPSCTDRSFANAMYNTCVVGNENGNQSFFFFSHAGSMPAPSLSPSSVSSHSTNESLKSCADVIFLADTRQRARGLFGIQHYAGPVEYDTRGFLEKNKDELPKEATALLASSDNRFLRHLGTLMSNKTTDYELNTMDRRTSRSPTMDRRTALSRSPSASSSIMRVSVGGQFSSQLRLLRSRIDVTRPHYIRCLKPNDDLIPDCFEPAVVADQLRYGGILEAIRVSRIGYSQRYAHVDFVRRYRILAQEELRESGRTCKIKSSEREQCKILVEAIGCALWNMEDRPPSMVDVQPCSIPASTFTKRRNSSRNATSWIKTKPMQSTHSIKATPSSTELQKLGLQMGKTKVFLRQSTFDILERKRNTYISSAATLINATVRMYLCRLAYYHALYAEYEALEAQEQYERSIIGGDAMEMIRKFEVVDETMTEWKTVAEWKATGEDREFKWMMVDGRWVRNHDGCTAAVG